MPSPLAQQAPLVIIGGGVIGISTAYFLSLRNPTREIYIIESSPSIFPSASARAGGFLAKDWFSSSLADLGILSFDLHRKLAEKHGGAEKWGYAGSVGLSLITRKSFDGLCDGIGPTTEPAPRFESWLLQNASRAEAAAPRSGTMTPVEPAIAVDPTEFPPWLSTATRPQVEVISRPDSTAQIDPLRFCNFLMGGCIARGVHLHLSTTTTRTITNPETGALCAVELSTDITIPCSQILIAAGVWTPSVLRTLFPSIPLTCPALNVSSLAGHSIIYRCPKAPSSASPSGPLCHAVFTTDDTANFSPEVFSRRPNNEIYLAGLDTSNLPFPALASEIPVPPLDDPTIVRLARVGESLISHSDDRPLEIVKTQLCHRPVLPDGKPIMGRIPDEQLGRETPTSSSSLDGVYVCVGHGPWGITLGPGSGLVMAEMLEGAKRTSANVEFLSVKHAVASSSI